MARPVKDGLDYFPLDVDFGVDEKTEAIMGEFGAKGVLAMVYLLSAVYKKGYYLQWDKLIQMQLVNRISGTNAEMINQIVNRLVAYGTFNEELFNSAKVLTSQRIQQTYLDATKRRKNQKQSLYWINENNNTSSNGVNVDINTQSKVKKSKLNKSNVVDGAENNPVDLWTTLWGFPNAVAQTDLSTWREQFGDELVSFAISYAGRRNVKSTGADRYLEKVFRGWEELKITTVEQAQEEAKKHEQMQSNNRGGVNGSASRVKEHVPDWAESEYKPETKKATPEEIAKLKAQIEAQRQQSEV